MILYLAENLPFRGQKEERGVIKTDLGV